MPKFPQMPKVIPLMCGGNISSELQKNGLTAPIMWENFFTPAISGATFFPIFSVALNIILYLPNTFLSCKRMEIVAAAPQSFDAFMQDLLSRFSFYLKCIIFCIVNALADMQLYVTF